MLSYVAECGVNFIVRYLADGWVRIFHPPGRNGFGGGVVVESVLYRHR